MDAIVSGYIWLFSSCLWHVFSEHWQSLLFQLRRPRRHSVSSLSTQDEFTEDYEDTADMDRNNCNTHVNSGDPWTTTNSPSQPSGHGRTTIPEDLTHASSQALRHSGHGPLHTRVDLSVTGHALLPNGGVLANTNYSTHDTDDDSDDSQATIEDSVVVPRTNGWPSHGVNESVQCSMQDDGVARMSQDVGMDINTDRSSHTVATQYNSPSQQHRHRNHDRIVHYQQQVDRGQHMQWVSDECTNTERMDNIPTQRLTNDARTHGETSGSESDMSTRRVLFPDSGTRHHEHSPGARYPFHRPQFDNFSETGSYSPPREQRPQNRMDSWGREHDPSTGMGRRDRPHDDRARWEREHYAASGRERNPPSARSKWEQGYDSPTGRDHITASSHNRAIFNTSLNNDTRGGRAMPPQWATDRLGTREVRRVRVDENEWQPVSPPKVCVICPFAHLSSFPRFYNFKVPPNFSLIPFQVCFVKKQTDVAFSSACLICCFAEMQLSKSCTVIKN